MLSTGLRQLGFAWSMLSGRGFRVRDAMALADDVRATIEEFGSAGDGAGDMLSAPDPEVQDGLTRRRLRRTVRNAARHTPYYRHLFERIGVDPASVTPDTIASIPPTPKNALRSMPAAFVSDRARPAMAAQTTGTTGIPTTVWFSQYELDITVATGALALMLTAGLRSEHVWANCITTRSIAQYLEGRSVPMAGAGYVPIGPVDPRVALDRLATPMHLPGKRPQITHLNATPSYLAAIVQEAERDGWTAADFGLQEIHVGGEILTDALRDRARELFNVPVTDGYSMTEIIPVAGQVCAHDHLHLPVDLGYVEVLDPVTLEPAAPGAVGSLTITPFLSYRDTTTLLRYVTGDLVRVLPEAEKLGCEMAAVPATSRILGRVTGSDLTTRDVLELLQAERALPLPTRYAIEETGDPGGPVLHVVAERASRTLSARLEGRVADLALPLSGVVLVEDPADLPTPCRVRADLREHTFHTVPAGRSA
ncbi:AMP-binding protein [Actinoallomurus purpureus]|uniref:phenylacetate--CoA ligase family protein n=1 Tax=Actinoallomurus purpureus TaxID=478114 RepID=UPI0020922E02|nr:AMP-binding protein [Actinoallomurus purpureus]MCO6007356.1 AMP-binding protein [Actinoallomurus purpureus]